VKNRCANDELPLLCLRKIGEGVGNGRFGPWGGKTSPWINVE